MAKDPESSALMGEALKDRFENQVRELLQTVEGQEAMNLASGKTDEEKFDTIVRLYKLTKGTPTERLYQVLDVLRQNKAEEGEDTQQEESTNLQSLTSQA